MPSEHGGPEQSTRPQQTPGGPPEKFDRPGQLLSTFIFSGGRRATLLPPSPVRIESPRPPQMALSSRVMLGPVGALFLVIASCVPAAYSDPRITQAALICLNGTGTPTTNIVSNFLTLFRDVADQLNTRLYGISSITSPAPAIYALVQCHEDLSATDCLLCFAQGRPIIPRCSVLSADSGRLYLDGCFLRFDYYNFFNETIDPVHDLVTCNSTNATTGTGQLQSGVPLGERVNRVLGNITQIALQSKGLFGAYGSEGVYGLAQCWNSLTVDECRECLNNAVSKIKGCLPKVEGRAMNAGCFVRYSNQKFYGDSNSNGSMNIGVIIAIASSAAAATSLFFIGTYLGYKRWSKKRQVRNRLFGLPDALRRSNLVFQYEVLEQATDFFDESRKLGQGGAGSVYKGILPNGRVIAVKRLVFNTRQWVDEFFNEINLISGIEHPNLVKLLGCSIEGPESLLVYEFIQNRSLDQVLFANNPIRVLSWQERIRIIRGTAAGLAYLHEGCIVKIIHRDIKTSNVLLDENFTAKIADFGLVRRLEQDRSHLSTGIAGTLGYMAPEYLVRGQLSEKADVYSFGVLLLEVLSGRKNTVFARGSGALLQSVWRNYQTNSLPECFDPALRSRFPFADATNAIKIGLLCTQASPELRPSMPEVVRMLNNSDVIVPQPKQPPFLNSNVLSSDDSSQSWNTNTNTGVSNKLTNSDTSVSAGSISLTAR